jgi:LPS O-antigen subunit length determinant protein (WzzB/FepE family)
MPRQNHNPARKAVPRLALYLMFSFIAGAMLVFLWTGMHG